MSVHAVTDSIGKTTDVEYDGRHLATKITDANSLPAADEAVFVIGEEYYYAAHTDRKTCATLAENGAEFLPKAIAVWQRIIEKMPDSANAAQAWYFLAVCYQQSGDAEKATRSYNTAMLKNKALARGSESTQIALAGDRYCGAYAVWHLLKYYGKAIPIDDIAGRMSIAGKGFSTMRDIVETLKYYEIPAQAMRIPTDKSVELKEPFVQYYVPMSGSDLGHFVLCIPIETGKAMILDGVKEPQAIDLAVYEAKEAFWDGMIILIQQSREDYLSQLISQQISWRTALATGQCWLNDNEAAMEACLNQSSIYYAKLTDELQRKYIGGCDLDCQKNGTKCSTNINCKRDPDCPLAKMVCDSDLVGWACLPSSGGIIPCIILPPQNCYPEQPLTGFCAAGVCGVYHRGDPYCGNTTVGQCRDWWW